jgi:LAO/AO transport system kinase
MVTLCEAAGYDTILIETVGVGQSETEVSNLADLVLLVLGPAGGDDLQGVKRGIIEIADLIAINKADGPLLGAARQTQRQYGQALHLFPPKPHGQTVDVLLASALQETGIMELWSTLDALHNNLVASGYKAVNRRHQQLAWFADALTAAWAVVLEARSGPEFQAIRQSVAECKTWPPAAARQAMAAALKTLNE